MQPSRQSDHGAMWVAALLAVIAVLALSVSGEFSMFASIFPRTIGLAMLIGSLFAGWRAWRGTAVRSRGLPRDGMARSLLLIVIMIAWIALLETAGFALASWLAFVALALIADRNRFGVGRAMLFAVIGLVLVVGFQSLFEGVLSVRLPAGVLLPRLFG